MRAKKVVGFLTIIVLLHVISFNSNFFTKIDIDGNNTFEKAQTFETAKILFDESHAANGSAMFYPSNTSFFATLLEENGYNSLTTNFDQEITTALLSQYDIFVVFFPMYLLVRMKSPQFTILYLVEVAFFWWVLKG